MSQPGTQTKPAGSKLTAEGAYTNFMSRTYAMEHEGTERYAQFAEQLEVNGDGECASLFRQLAEVEDRHANRILVKMGWTSLPALSQAYAGAGGEAGEAASFDPVPCLMHPHQALELALRREVQAQKYFEGIASGSAPQRVRMEAAVMAAEERAYARLIEHWLSRVPPPASGGAQEQIGL